MSWISERSTASAIACCARGPSPASTISARAATLITRAFRRISATSAAGSARCLTTPAQQHRKRRRALTGSTIRSAAMDTARCWSGRARRPAPVTSATTAMARPATRRGWDQAATRAASVTSPAASAIRRRLRQTARNPSRFIQSRSCRTGTFGRRPTPLRSWPTRSLSWSTSSGLS